MNEVSGGNCLDSCFFTGTQNPHRKDRASDETLRRWGAGQQLPRPISYRRTIVCVEYTTTMEQILSSMVF
jgi:hypothetical protein